MKNMFYRIGNIDKLRYSKGEVGSKQLYFECGGVKL